MAYMSQEMKKALAPQIKAVLKKHGYKASISVYHHSKLNVTIRSGATDLIEVENQRRIKAGNSYKVEAAYTVNPYCIDSVYTGKIKEFLTELRDAMNGNGCATVKNHNNSDSQSDYFDVGWYIDISVGTYDKPYKVAN